jgi:hypothetical protein
VRRAAAPILLALVAGACSRGGDGASGPRGTGRADRASADAGPLGGERPLDALALDADDVARRLGSFEWAAAVEWTVSRQGDDALRVRAVERHRIRQSATGDFDVAAEIDPGLGPGSETGKEIVRAGGMTYARARWAPWRERPTDRGRDARRFRDESFSAPAAVLRLCGPVAAAPAGETTAAGRPARRFSLSLAKDAPAPPAPARPEGAPPPDEDTRRRLRFLEGRLPVSCAGELLLDAETGAPLSVRLAAVFGVKDEPKVRAAVELLAQVKGIGGEVPAIAAPRSPLPDERKAAGVAGALDAAGLRKRAEERPGRAEPADEPGE